MADYRLRKQTRRLGSRIGILLGALLLGAAWPAHAAPRVTVLAHGFGEPDDLAWGPRGSIYFSDFGNNAVDQLLPDGRRLAVRAGLAGPEGIVVERDGTLVIVEQNRNRLLRLDPRTGITSVLATIPNPTNQMGIDGIALDPRDDSIVVPDSPSGRVLRISHTGRVRVLAGGLGRPVDALVLADSSIMVVDEYRNGAFRIDRRGTVRRIGGFLSVPDDILSDGQGGFYITCLGDNTLRHRDQHGAITLVAAGLADPQGMLRRKDGTLIVAEETANTFVTVRP